MLSTPVGSNAQCRMSRTVAANSAILSGNRQLHYCDPKADRIPATAARGSESEVVFKPRTTAISRIVGRLNATVILAVMEGLLLRQPNRQRYNVRGIRLRQLTKPDHVVVGVVYGCSQHAPTDILNLLSHLCAGVQELLQSRLNVTHAPVAHWSRHSRAVAIGVQTYFLFSNPEANVIGFIDVRFYSQERAVQRPCLSEVCDGKDDGIHFAHDCSPSGDFLVLAWRPCELPQFNLLALNEWPSAAPAHGSKRRYAAPAERA